MNPTSDELIQEVHKTVSELKVVLVGIPDTDDKGVCGEIKDIKLAHNELAIQHRKLSRNFWLLVGTLTGSGVIGGGIYQLLAH